MLLFYCQNSAAAGPRVKRDSFPFSAPFVGRESRRTASWQVMLLLALCVAAGLLSSTGDAIAAEPVPMAASPDTQDTLAAHVSVAASRSGISAAWIRAVLQAESGGNTNAVSPKGAMGPMQIMPGTWEDLRNRYSLGPDPFDVSDNILAGAFYLRELFDRYGSPGFLAAYNAGPGRYDDYLLTGHELPDETRTYIATVASMVGLSTRDGIGLVGSLAAPWTEAELFVGPKISVQGSDPAPVVPSISSGATDDRTAPSSTFEPRSGGLFVQRSSPAAPPLPR